MRFTFYVIEDIDLNAEFVNNHPLKIFVLFPRSLIAKCIKFRKNELVSIVIFSDKYKIYEQAIGSILNSINITELLISV